MDLLGELRALIAAFDHEQLDYALCGGVALAVHGVPRATQDIDILVREEQLEVVRAAARSCGFTLQTSAMTFSNSGITLYRSTKIQEQQHLMLNALIAGPLLDTVWRPREARRWQAPRPGGRSAAKGAHR
jgi:hypothetical protein